MVWRWNVFNVYIQWSEHEILWQNGIDWFFASLAILRNPWIKCQIQIQFMFANFQVETITGWILIMGLLWWLWHVLIGRIAFILSTWNGLWNGLQSKHRMSSDVKWKEQNNDKNGNQRKVFLLNIKSKLKVKAFKWIVENKRKQWKSLKAVLVKKKKRRCQMHSKTQYTYRLCLRCTKLPFYMGSIEIFDSAEQISKWTTEIYQVKVYSDSNWSNRSNNKTTLTYKYTRSYQYYFFFKLAFR